jgi:hypothetical protein
MRHELLADRIGLLDERTEIGCYATAELARDIAPQLDLLLDCESGVGQLLRRDFYQTPWTGYGLGHVVPHRGCRWRRAEF